MTGYVDEDMQPKVSLVVKGLRQAMPLEAIGDTGFNGDLCLPISFAIQVGLELWGEQEFELANGSMSRDLMFIGRVVFENEERDVLISLTSSKEALLGCRLLKGRKLEIGFISRTLTILPEKSATV